MTVVGRFSFKKSSSSWTKKNFSIVLADRCQLYCCSDDDEKRYFRCRRKFRETLICQKGRGGREFIMEKKNPNVRPVRTSSTASNRSTGKPEKSEKNLPKLFAHVAIFWAPWAREKRNPFEC